MDKTTRLLLAIIAACLVWISMRLGLPTAQAQPPDFLIAAGHGTIVWRIDVRTGELERCQFNFGCQPITER